MSTENEKIENIENDERKTTASTQRQYEITRANLPLCCPLPDMRLWDSHPRVYLPIEKTGKATCPYCDAKYTLIDF